VKSLIAGLIASAAIVSSPAQARHHNGLLGPVLDQLFIGLLQGRPVPTYAEEPDEVPGYEPAPSSYSAKIEQPIFMRIDPSLDRVPDTAAPRIWRDNIYWIPYGRTLSRAQIDAVHGGVLAMLRDPQSAIFGRAGSLISSRGALLVCGWVNARNNFGGYVGDTLYMVDLDGEVASAVDVGGFASETPCRGVKF